jgi:glycosyltransferase involved in cell wall biosynthesis
MVENSKKIIIFSTAYLPLIGGAELAIKSITDRLPQYDFTLITARMRRNLPREERLGNVLVRRIGFGFVFDKWLLPIYGAFVAWRLVKRIKNQELRIKGGAARHNSEFLIHNSNVVLWGMMASQGSLAAYFLKKIYPELKFVLTLQEGDPEEYLLHGRWGLMGVAFRRIVRSADYIQTISEYLKGLASKVGASAPIEVVPNGVDLKSFGIKNQELGIKELRIKFGIADNNKVIITTSRLVEKNAVDTVIRSLAALKTKRPDQHFKFLIVGVGPDEAKLKTLADELGVAGDIIWAGLIDYNELPKHLALADIFVRPSRSEGLGNAFLEAMACEVPVIGTPVGGIPDFLRDHETGLTVAVDGINDLAFAMEKLIFDETLRAKIIPTARTLVVARYDWEAIAQKMDKIFRRLSGGALA